MQTSFIMQDMSQTGDDLIFVRRRASAVLAAILYDRVLLAYVLRRCINPQQNLLVPGSLSWKT